LTKIFYFISAYKEPESIVRLVNILDDDELHYFYIHFDKQTDPKLIDRLKELIEKSCHTKNIKIISEFICKWASFGIVDATLSAMKFSENLDYDYFINLTGECYPVKSRSQIQQTFEKNNMAFLTYWKLPYDGWYQGGLNRVNNMYFSIPKRGYPYVRLFKIPRLRKRLPGNLQFYGGWSLFCLPKDIIRYLVSFTENNPKFKAFFKRVHAPSEMYFQTILLNSPFVNRIVNDNKRYIDFIDAHPRTITIKDFEMLKQGDYLFARKFNPQVDKKIMDCIDKEIMGETSF